MHTNDQESLARLCLLRCRGIGPIRYRALLKHFGTAQAALRATPDAWRRQGLGENSLASLRKPDWKGAEQDMAWSLQTGHSLIFLGEPAYPPLLATYENAPARLFVDGDARVLQRPQIAMVGSRNPTAGGAENAFEFARHLARMGLIITSGLALGVDAASHQGCLEAGPTIAVTGHGPDRIYPARHKKLGERIRARGAIVSEYPVGTAAAARHFPQRNRIISAMSLGTVVVEAAVRSGSLITARLAMEQGREVFAIPGSIHNPMARGCHKLIREGAKLVETAEDILEELGALAMHLAMPPEQTETAPGQEAVNPGVKEPDTEYLVLLEALGHDPLGVDHLVRRTGLTPEVVSSMLLSLELQGHVSALGGGKYARLVRGKT